MGSPYVFLFFFSAVRHSISRVGQHGVLGSNYYSVHCTVVSMPSYSGGGGKIEIRTREDKPPALLFPRFSGWEKCDGRGGGLGSHHQLFGYSIRDGESYGRLVDGTAGSQLQNGGTSAGYLCLFWPRGSSSAYGDDVCVPEWKVQWQHPLHAGEECGFRSSKKCRLWEGADCFGCLEATRSPTPIRSIQKQAMQSLNTTSLFSITSLSFRHMI